MTMPFYWGNKKNINQNVVCWNFTQHAKRQKMAIEHILYDWRKSYSDNTVILYCSTENIVYRDNSLKFCSSKNAIIFKKESKIITLQRLDRTDKLILEISFVIYLVGHTVLNILCLTYCYVVYRKCLKYSKTRNFQPTWPKFLTSPFD